MAWVFAATIVALLGAVALALLRAVRGPTVFDRLQSASTIGTTATLLLALISFFGGRQDFLDLALTYGLLNVIGVIAVLKFFLKGDLGAADPRPPRDDAP